MKKVIIYTDGACSGNPGEGGWGSVLMYGGVTREASGYAASTTNNIMELTAAIEALSMLKEQCEVELYSDSAYLINSFQKRWVFAWARAGWIKSDKSPVKNIELWKRLLELNSTHKITWLKVKGHADNEHNERCDALARGEITRHRQNRDGG